MDLSDKILSRFMTRIIIFIMSFFLSIIITRGLGPRGKGIYAMVFLISTMLFLLGDFGIGMANTYFTGKKRIEISFMSSNSLLFGSINGIALAALFLLFYHFFGGIFFKGINPPLIYLVLLTIPFTLISNYLSGILLGKHKIKELNWIMLFTTAANLAGAAVILLVLKKGVLSLVLLSILISIANSIISVILVSNFAKIKLSFNIPAFKAAFNFGAKGYLANIIMFLNYRLDMVLVNFFINVTQVGFYSLAVNIAEMVWYLPNAVGVILFPEIASSDSARSSHITKKLTRHLVIIMLILCGLLALAGRFLIKIVYGSAFAPSYMPVLFLLPGIYISAITTPIGAYLNGIGLIKYAPLITAVSLITNISLNLLLIPKIGINGAALASSVSYTLGACIGTYLFFKTSKNNIINTFIMKKEDWKDYLFLLKKIKMVCSRRII